MLQLPQVGFSTDAELIEKELTMYESIWKAERAQRRLFQLLREQSAKKKISENGRSWSLQFLKSPKAIVGDEKVQGLCMEVNRFDETPVSSWSELGRRKVIGTGEHTKVPYDMIVSCIGFRNMSAFELSTSGSNQAIINEQGRVPKESGLYVCGWAATGPEGELSAAMRNAHVVADSIASDFENSSNSVIEDGTLPALLDRLRIDYVSKDVV